MQMLVLLTITDIVIGIFCGRVMHTLRKDLQGVRSVRLIHYNKMKSLISSNKSVGEFVRVCI